MIAYDDDRIMKLQIRAYNIIIDTENSTLQ